MNNLEQRIIEELILEPQTADGLARLLSVDRSCVIDILEEMAITNQVRTQVGLTSTDTVCSNCGVGYIERERAVSCRRWLGDCRCSGVLKDACAWFYCGGPISKALEAAA
jgi:hypothetical protein